MELVFSGSLSLLHRFSRPPSASDPRVRPSRSARSSIPRLRFLLPLAILLTTMYLHSLPSLMRATGASSPPLRTRISFPRARIRRSGSFKLGAAPFCTSFFSCFLCSAEGLQWYLSLSAVAHHSPSLPQNAVQVQCRCAAQTSADSAVAHRPRGPRLTSSSSLAQNRAAAELQHGLTELQIFLQRLPAAPPAAIQSAIDSFVLPSPRSSPSSELERAG